MIEGRKPKPYSEKLFNELCILHLLAVSLNQADGYIVKKLFDVSPRTLTRYVTELHESGLTPPIEYRRIRYEYFPRELHESQAQLEYAYTCPVWDPGLGPNAAYLFTDYINGNLNEERQQDRLFRCGCMLVNSLESLKKADDYDEEYLAGIPANDFVIIDGERYFFYSFDRCDELYHGLSTRTQQRDIKVVRDVLARMYRFIE